MLDDPAGSKFEEKKRAFKDADIYLKVILTELHHEAPVRAFDDDGSFGAPHGLGRSIVLKCIEVQY